MKSATAGMPQPARRAAAGTRRRVVLAAWLTLAALLAVVLAVLWSATPSKEAVRQRNALLAEIGTPADFDWTPDAPPPGYLAQQGPLPPEFIEAARTAAPPGPPTFERALALVRHLDQGAVSGDPLQGDTRTTYARIRRGEGGYCSDYTQVFNGLALAAGIGVREWGAAFDGFGGWGHAFSEVYLPETGKWAMIDPFYAFWVRDSATGQPLSVQEFRQRLALPDPLAGMSIQVVVPTMYDFTSPQKLMAWYGRGTAQFYLWWGNNVFDYDDQPLVRIAARFSRSAEQLAAVIVGVHPRIRILPAEASGPAYDRFVGNRLRLRIWTALAIVLGLLLVAELAWLRRRPG